MKAAAPALLSIPFGVELCSVVVPGLSLALLSQGRLGLVLPTNLNWLGPTRIRHPWHTTTPPNIRYPIFT